MSTDRRTHANCECSTPHGSHYWGTGPASFYCPGVPTADGSPLTLSAYIEGPEQCMADAALDWCPLLLELLAAIDAPISRVGLAQYATCCYPQVDSYGLYLACMWCILAPPYDPIGA
jgi:hypothetical protein